MAPNGLGSVAVPAMSLAVLMTLVIVPQDSGTIVSRSTPPPEAERLVETLSADGIELDLSERTITAPGYLLLDRIQSGYPIEYLLVTESGFTHEALSIATFKPSNLNAGFLALGLEPGETMVTTPPKGPDDDTWEATAPRGHTIDVAVAWTDEEGDHLHAIEDLIAYMTNGRPAPRRAFTYIGSRFRRVTIGTERTEVYMADTEGNLISLYVAGAGNCILDPNGIDTAHGLAFDVNASLVPMRGTPLKFIMTVR